MATTTFKSYNELTAMARTIIDACKQTGGNAFKVLDQTISLRSAEDKVSACVADCKNIDKWDGKKQNEFIRNLAKIVALRRSTVAGIIKDIYEQIDEQQWYVLTGTAKNTDTRNQLIKEHAGSIYQALHIGEIYKHTFTFNCFVWDGGKDKNGNVKLFRGIPANLSELGGKWANEHRQNVTIPCEELEAEMAKHVYINANNVVCYTQYKRAANTVGVMTWLFNHRDGIKPVATDKKVVVSANVETEKVATEQPKAQPKAKAAKSSK